MGYGAWLHGEGVGAGMVMAAELSHRLGLVDDAFVARLKVLVQRAGLPAARCWMLPTMLVAIWN